MNPNNNLLHPVSPRIHAWCELLPSTLRGIVKHAALLMLGIAMLSQTAYSAVNYGTAVLANNPLAFWQLNETDFFFGGGVPAVDATGNGFNGTYGASAWGVSFGVLGPQPPTYIGFTNGQGAVLSFATDTNSTVRIPALNLNTNTVTIAMWINPGSPQPDSTGLLMNRTGSDVAGLAFGTANDSTGMAALGYVWNNNAQATWGFNSGLFPVSNIWQFVALVVNTDSATLYLNYIDPATGGLKLLSAVNPIAHNVQAFNGDAYIGSDVLNGISDTNRIFNGSIAGAVVYKSALTKNQILALYAAGFGLSGLPPSINGQPKNQYVLAGSPAKFSVTSVSGTSPYSLQWQLNGTNINLLSDSANFTGANSNTLSILASSANDAGSYRLVVSNDFGSTISSNAVLTIQTPQLVGKWLTNNTLADVSGYPLAGKHSAYAVGAGAVMFTNDVPPGKTGQALVFLDSASGISITNSSTLDGAYDDTFDGVINNAMTVAVWAKGFPGGWSPFVSKWGDFITYPDYTTTSGWQLRSYGQPYPCFTLRDLNVGTNILGGIAGDDMGAPAFLTVDGLWHYYVATFDAVTGIRSLYVDGQLAAQNGNDAPYALASAAHLTIGARDTSTGNNFQAFATANMAVYDVRIYNYAITESTVKNLYGAVPVQVGTQPKSTSVFAGESAKVSANVVGTPPIAYQWRLNGTNINLLPNISNVTGANSNVLTILSMTTNDAGLYSLFATNLYGMTTSSNAYVFVTKPIMIGRWLDGSNGLTEVSGYVPPGTHDAYSVGGGNYVFTNDVPPGMTGQSIWFTGTDSGLAVTNSSTADGAYTNTFDGSAFSVSFWAKDRGPFGGNWHAWVAKDGYNNNGEYNGIGWSVGIEAWSQYLYFDMEGVDQGGITYTLGQGLWGNGIMESSPQGLPGEDTSWHHYAITYSATAKVRRTYFDGNLVAQQNGVGLYASAANKHLTIGAQEQTVNGFTGFNRTKMYDVRMYNYAMTSNDVLALLPDPVITVQPPQTLNAYAGNIATITATTLTHSSPVTNQWQHEGTNLVDGDFGASVIYGANLATLKIGNVTPMAAGAYRLVVSNPNGKVISSNTTVTVLNTVAPPAGSLVGAWVTGDPNLADTSGFSPAGTHDGYGVTGTGTAYTNYIFTNDVPPGYTGQSLALLGTNAIAIANSATADLGYVSTFDDTITNMTVAFWAKGVPSGGWNPFISKYGENGQGWQLRRNGGLNPTWSVRGSPGNDDMSAGVSFPTDGLWHHYAGTFTFDGITGTRNLYMDGTLIATEDDSGPYTMAPSSYLSIGGRHDGTTFGNYFTGGIYGARIYDVALTEAQINSLAYKALVVPVTYPTFTGQPTLDGSKFILKWSTGTLLQSTNILGPWTPTPGATSPYTNDIMTSGQLYFRLSNP